MVLQTLQDLDPDFAPNGPRRVTRIVTPGDNKSRLVGIVLDSAATALAYLKKAKNSWLFLRKVGSDRSHMLLAKLAELRNTFAERRQTNPDLDITYVHGHFEIVDKRARHKRGAKSGSELGTKAGTEPRKRIASQV